MDEFNVSFEVEEATLSKLYEAIEEIDVTITPSFRITDKHGNSAIYKRERIINEKRP